MALSALITDCRHHTQNREFTFKFKTNCVVRTTPNKTPRTDCVPPCQLCVSTQNEVFKLCCKSECVYKLKLNNSYLQTITQTLHSCTRSHGVNSGPSLTHLRTTWQTQTPWSRRLPQQSWQPTQPHHAESWSMSPRSGAAKWFDTVQFVTCCTLMSYTRKYVAHHINKPWEVARHAVEHCKLRHTPRCTTCQTPRSMWCTQITRWTSQWTSSQSQCVHITTKHQYEDTWWCNTLTGSWRSADSNNLGSLRDVATTMPDASISVHAKTVECEEESVQMDRVANRVAVQTLTNS